MLEKSIFYKLRTSYKVSLLYSLIWLAPIIFALIATMNGYAFSYVGIEWQKVNQNLIISIILFAILGSFISSFILIELCSLLARHCRVKLKKLKVCFSLGATRFEKAFIALLALVSIYGIYYSMGGNVFAKSYEGPSDIWLQIGAWNIIYLFCLTYFLGVFYNKFDSIVTVLFFLTLFFLPLLMTGSRIDFLSFSLFILVVRHFISDEASIKRLIDTGCIFIWVLMIGLLTAKYRYSFDSVTFDGTYAQQPLSPFRIINIESGPMFYLSTFGDIAASVFQVVGLVEAGQMDQAGWRLSIFSYIERMVPGMFMTARPADLWVMLSPENLGGGALHAIGEGYLVSGFSGVLVISVFFGGLAAISGIFAEKLKSSKNIIYWLLFAFPWLLLIRGGWYQFFAIFKSISVLVVFILLIFIIRKVRLNFTGR